ncbi:MAG: S41 family peptidase [Gammaproteobacteria bacterium]|nr:MAG: S41 family peptidase [Gammaproteobacteria bacterium]
MNHALRNIFICLLFLLAGARIAIGEAESPEAEALPLNELRTFTEIFAKIKSDYVEKVDDKELLENAIRGMLEGLDPHSAYLDEDSYKDLQEGTSGEFGGLGIEVGMENGFVKVISPIDDTPAQKAGIKAGDLIIKLDDRSVKGMSLNDAVDIMRGKPGDPITLTIIRESEEKPLVITVVRDIIKTKSVRFETLEPGFGYLRISSFQSHTVESLRQAIYQLKEDNSGKLKGIVLDLRNNPGGILTAAVGVSDMFLNKGMIVYTEGRKKDSKLKFNAKPNAKLPDVPLIVLVNAGSASASEIVAGALQDHGRGIIMGEKTFGKGSVQTILLMNNNAALKLTTARYYTPNGRSIQASGITPDIVIDKVKISKIEEAFGTSVKEADLIGHLDNGQEEAPVTDGDNEELKKDISEEETVPLSSRDYELYEALNVLKGLAIIKK